MRMACRLVWDTHVFICTWHFTQAVLKQVRNKLRDVSRFRECFKAIHGIMCLEADGSREERLRKVNAAIAEFKQAFRNEPEVVKYFEQEWEPKRGARSRCTL